MPVLPMLSQERIGSLRKFVVYFYILFAGLILFVDGLKKGDYLEALFGVAALPATFVLHSLLTRTRKTGRAGV